jgi:predicted unusual protein kinase regulating ubiquinone biosynthesis (AarF/ABC1/UbiB family)
MSFLESRALETAADAPEATRNRLAHNLIDLVLTEMFQFGTMQTDPNFANYRLCSETGRIVLLDFGATRDLDPNVVALYRRLFVSGLAGDATALAETCTEMGLFTDQTPADHRKRMLGMIELVFDAVRANDLYDFADQELSRRMNQEGMALAEEGVTVPPLPIDILFVQRKLGGVFLIAANLSAKVPLHALLSSHLAEDAPGA